MVPASIFFTSLYFFSDNKLPMHENIMIRNGQSIKGGQRIRRWRQNRRINYYIQLNAEKMLLFGWKEIQVEWGGKG